jgi:membrane protein implicated in regulation of membrane protease activity
MTIGSSVLLIAIGAILRYAVTATTSGVSIQTVGLILMLAGILGLVLSLLYMFVWRPRRTSVEPGIERTRYEPPDTY